MANIKVVVGLGNPGSKYEDTRHNIGFDVIDRLALSQSGVKFAKKFESEIADIELDFNRVMLVKPMTFMNLSGKAVAQVMQFYKIPLVDLLVICDDLSLPLGRLRIRAGGSDGGQRGLRDISRALGTDQFPRARLGIGDRGIIDAADYVLAKFRPSERPAVSGGVMTTLQAVSVWMNQGIEAAMNRFNGMVDPHSSI